MRFRNVVVGHSGYKFKGNWMPLTTMQPSDHPLQWSRGSTRRNERGYWWRYDVGLTPNPAVCTNTGTWSGIWECTEGFAFSCKNLFLAPSGYLSFDIQCRLLNKRHGYEFWLRRGPSLHVSVLVLSTCFSALSNSVLTEDLIKRPSLFTGCQW